MVVAILGLGEAGSVLARELVAAGATVRGWDPEPAESVDRRMLAADATEAAAEADVVMSVNTAEVSVEVARSTAGALHAGGLFADLNTAAPAIKREVAEVVSPTGATFADVALMAPVPRRGLRTPALAAGPGAERFREAFSAFGMPVDVVGTQAGDAAARKLLRSVLMKGLAAAIGEALAGARELGCEPWLRSEVERTLTEADGSMVDRLDRGSIQHAARRTVEMEAAADALRDLGVKPRIAEASGAWLRELAGRQQGRTLEEVDPG